MATMAPETRYDFTTCDSDELRERENTEVSTKDACYQVQFAKKTLWQDPAIRSAWEKLIDRHEDGVAIVQSPMVFDYLAVTQDEKDLALLIVYDSSGSIVGVIPAHATETTLELNVGRHCLGKFRIRSTVILGGWPSMPSNAVLCDRVLAMLEKRFPESQAIRINALPTSSPLWQHVRKSGTVHKRYHAYVPDGPRGCHTSPLPDTFEQYLAKYSRKRRFNLRRQVKLLRNHGGGLLELKRVDSRDDLPYLFKALEAVMGPYALRRSNYHKTAEMLASKGLLLCYVLVCGHRPCAIACGSRRHSKYLLDRTAFSPEFQEFSPGTSLLYLLVEDLLCNRLAKHIDFGFGEPIGPYRATNVIVERATVLLFQKRLLNRMRIASHLLFSLFVRCAKIVLGRLNGILPLAGGSICSFLTSAWDAGEPLMFT
jgi:hypothetical protein